MASFSKSVRDASKRSGLRPIAILPVLSNQINPLPDFRYLLGYLGVLISYPETITQVSLDAVMGPKELTAKFSCLWSFTNKMVIFIDRQ